MGTAENLPFDLLIHIFKFVAQNNVKDLINLLSVCKLWAKAASADILWKELFVKQFYQQNQLLTNIKKSDTSSDLPCSWLIRYKSCSTKLERWSDEKSRINCSLIGQKGQSFCLTNLDGNIYAGYSNGFLGMWENVNPLKTQVQAKSTFQAHTAAVTGIKSILTQNEEKLVFSVSADTSLKAWNMETQACISAFPFLHSGCINDLDVRLGNSLTFITTCGDDGTIKFIDLEHHAIFGQATFQLSPVYCCKLGEKISYSDCLFTGGFDNRALMVDMRTLSLSSVIGKHRFRVYDIFQTNHIVVTASGDGVMRMFDMRMLGTSPLSESIQYQTNGWLESIFVDDSMILSGGQGCNVNIWNSTGKFSGNLTFRTSGTIWEIQKFQVNKNIFTELNFGVKFGGTYAIAHSHGINLVSCDIFKNPKFSVNTNDNSNSNSNSSSSSITWIQGDSGSAHRLTRGLI